MCMCVVRVCGAECGCERFIKCFGHYPTPHTPLKKKKMTAATVLVVLIALEYVNITQYAALPILLLLLLFFNGSCFFKASRERIDAEGSLFTVSGLALKIDH